MNEQREPSLIQQRLTIQRHRAIAMVWLIVGCAGVALGVTILLLSSSLGAPGSALVFLAAAIYGVVRLVFARRERIAFEAQHGRDAGLQKASPVSRGGQA